MATFNGSAFVLQQVSSILSQLGPEDELVVSDNCSVDSTVSILKSFNDVRIKIYAEHEQGVVSNFANALSHCKGDIIFLVDQDDVWFENKVSVVLDALSSVDLVLHDACVVDTNLNVINDSLFELNATSKGLIRNLSKNSYVGCCMAFNRTVLHKSMPIPNNVPMHDWWIGLIAERYYRVKHLKTALIKYRRHANNVSFTSSNSATSLVRKLRWRLALGYELLVRRFR